MTLANDVGTPGTKQHCIAHVWHEVAVGGRDVYSQCRVCDEWSHRKIRWGRLFFLNAKEREDSS